MIRPLPNLLALLLLLQAMLAPSLCLARAAAPAGLTLPICTAEGLRHVVLDAPGEAPAAEHGELCVVCHALPAGADTQPPSVSVPAWSAARVAWQPGPTAAERPAIRGPPFGARAPPNRF